MELRTKVLVCTKVLVPFRVPLLEQMPIIEGYVARLVVKNGHQITCVMMGLAYLLKI